MRIRLRLSSAILIALVSGGARAQGIPVIDVANLAQTIQQAVNVHLFLRDPSSDVANY